MPVNMILGVLTVSANSNVTVSADISTWKAASTGMVVSLTKLTAFRGLLVVTGWR